jgi:sulfide:quinone oxidoreductase
MRIEELSPRFAAAGQITAADLETIRARGFRSVVNNRPDGEVPGQPTSEEIAAAAADLGLQYLYIPVVSGALTLQNVEDFRAACPELEPPTLLFCRSGTRSTVLWNFAGRP